jgi:hypothetical protein
MAFKRPDVDAIYDKAIRPVLKELGCVPLRVDRVEHNDDIDDKIFELLEASQFCIADLTYARPSVYYEGGYSFGRGWPVIYTARADHFETKEEDKLGNFRVHFDLQMKNIIDWTAPNKTFIRRLRARIKHVITPLLKMRADSQKQEESEREFASNSESAKLKLIFDVTRKTLRAMKFKALDREQHEASVLFMGRIHKSTAQFIYVFPGRNLTQTRIKEIRQIWLGRKYFGLYKTAALEAAAIELYALIPTLATVRSSTLKNALPNFTPESSRSALVVSAFNPRPPESDDAYAVIGGVKSLDEYAKRLEQLFEDLDLV